MRLFHIAPLIAVALGGCSSANKDFGSALGDAFSGLNSGLAGGAALEYSLYQDYRRKSEQLQFISLNTYACGEPGTATQATIDKQDFVGIKKAQEELTKTFKQLDLLIAYGASVAEYRKGVTSFAAVADGVVKVTGSATKFGSSEVQAIGGIVSSFATLAKVAYTESEASELRRMAAIAKPQIKIWVEALKKNFVRVNASLLHAYHLWNGCALERLYYLRDTYPTGPAVRDSRGHVRFEGVIKSTALQFDAAYAEYIAEREKFLGAVPKYDQLLDTIAEANDKLLVVTEEDIGATLTSLGTVADALKVARDAVNGS